MVIRTVLASWFVVLALAPARAADLDLAAWARALPSAFSVSGSKVEPTYMAAIDMHRNGDRFAVLGGAPAWMERSLEEVSVDNDGVIRLPSCAKGVNCTRASHPSGFLSTASLVSASRKGALSGFVRTEPFGNFTVVCVDAETLGIPRPILDPCFEVFTGAAIAQKHRDTGRFDGPSLDPVTVRIHSDATHMFTTNPKDKAS